LSGKGSELATKGRRRADTLNLAARAAVGESCGQKVRGRLRVPVVFGLKKSYFFFFFAAFFAGFFAAFFLVAMLSILPFHFHGTLRYQIIAICSLYRVPEKNSQEKNAHEVAYLGDAFQ
jgi:hypothetical protein